MDTYPGGDQNEASANFDLNNFKTINQAAPTSPTDGANKAYVDAVASGLDVKQSVRAATTANITLSGTQTIDAVALSVGNRVLVKDQSTASQNGIYLVASGAWTRSPDADGTVINSISNVTSGLFTFIEEGNINASQGFVLSTNDPIVVGTTDLTFTQFSGAGNLTAGTGIEFIGSQITNTGVLTITGGSTVSHKFVSSISSSGSVTLIQPDQSDVINSAKSGANTDITSLQSSTTVTTQTSNDNSTKIASTAYVDSSALSKVPTSTQVIAGTGLSGGGTLTGDVTLSNTGVLSLTGTSGQILITGTTTPTLSLVTNTALPGSPTTTTQSQADNSTKIATTAYVDVGLVSKVPTTRQILAGTGLSGGGSLSGDITLTNTGVTSITGGGAVSNQFVSAISTAGSVSLSQPSFSNLSGSATTAQLPANQTQLTGTGTITGGTWSSTIGSIATGTTQSQADNSTKIATTAYVDTGLSGKSPTAGSSSLTTVASNLTLPGSPTTTTQTQADSSTKIATTAYVDTGLSGKSPTAGSSSLTVVASNINLPGSPTTTTQAANDNSTKIATTAYVNAAAPSLPLSQANGGNGNSNGAGIFGTTGQTLTASTTTLTASSPSFNICNRAGTMSITLPALSTCAGKPFLFSNITNNISTVFCAGADSFPDGATNIAFKLIGTLVLLINDGTYWYAFPGFSAANSSSAIGALAYNSGGFISYGTYPATSGQIALSGQNTNPSWSAYVEGKSNITASSVTLTNTSKRLQQIDCTSNSVTITLPAANGVGNSNNPGRYQFVRIDGTGNTCTIQRAGSDTIDGASSITLPQYGTLSIYNDSTSVWHTEVPMVVGSTNITATYGSGKVAIATTGLAASGANTDITSSSMTNLSALSTLSMPAAVVSTTTYSLLTTDATNILFNNASGGTITLFAAASNSGRIVTFKNVSGGGALVIAKNASDSSIYDIYTGPSNSSVSLKTGESITLIARSSGFWHVLTHGRAAFPPAPTSYYTSSINFGSGGAPSYFGVGALELIPVDCTGGAVTISLCNGNIVSGQRLSIIKTDSTITPVTINVNGGGTINGASSISLNSQYDSTIVYSDGTNWIIIKSPNGNGLNPVQTTTSGSTSGSFISSQPFISPGYKKFLIRLNTVTDAGTTLTFPVAFLQTPFVANNTSGLSISTLTTTQITIPASIAAVGWIIVEGY